MGTEKVWVGMSGGVDSSATALLLKKSGYQTAGVTLKLCPDDHERDLSDARSVCEKLGISHTVLDLKSTFRKTVIADFIDCYRQGLTPNPCVVCNRLIKFGAMLDRALALGYDKIATGHYARVMQDENGRFVIRKATDESKDQSYVLYSLSQHQLSHLLLPLGTYSKPEVRKIAHQADLICADRPDSQDICFVPDGNYADFIEQTLGTVFPGGEYTDESGQVLGTHAGIIHYTIGQRKGLGIALGKPRFVLDKNAETNRVILGDEEALFHREVTVKNPNFLPFDTLDHALPCAVKLRYRHKEQPAVISPAENGRIRIVFEVPQRAPSPGQAAVFYQGDLLLGGGTIL